MTGRPEDIAKLYSQAQLRGTRYWDFSASRKQVRGRFRERIVGEPAERNGASQPAALQPHQTLEQGIEQSIEQAPAPPLPQPQEGPANRWYALHSLLNPAQLAEQPLDAPVTLEHRPPMLVFLSLAGGVGKTCLAATLGRALAALGERVLLADTATCGLLPLYFGSREFRPGVVRTFSPPAVAAEADTPVQVLNLQAERSPGKGTEHDPLLGELLRDGRGASRILVDIATGNRDVTSRLLLLRPTVLVPVLPDISSVASLGFLQMLLDDEDVDHGTTLFLLNQFDESVPLHVDVRALLHQQLGDRLLPFVVRRSSAVSEALAEGMTVIDYAPGSEAAEDYRHLASWLRSFSPPAVQGYSGARWSERLSGD